MKTTPYLLASAFTFNLLCFATKTVYGFVLPYSLPICLAWLVVVFCYSLTLEPLAKQRKRKKKAVEDYVTAITILLFNQLLLALFLRYLPIGHTTVIVLVSMMVGSAMMLVGHTNTMAKSTKILEAK